MLLDTLARGCVSILGVKACLVNVLDERRERLEMGASAGLGPRFLAAGEEPVAIEAESSPALSGQTIEIPDLSAETRWPWRDRAVAEGLASVLAVPLAIRQRTVGEMQLYRDKPGPFPPDQKDLAQTIAVQAGIALERLRAVRRARALGEVSRAINSSLDPQEVLQTIVRQAAQVLAAKGASLRMLDMHGERLEERAAYGLSEAYVRKGPVDLEHSPVDRAVLEGREVFVSEADFEGELQYPAEARREGIRSILCVPLLIRGRPLGVLRVYSGARYEFSSSEREFLASLASQGAVAIENARLFEHLRRDYEDLTKAVWTWYDWGERAPRM